jgi:hypothetical protein
MESAIGYWRNLETYERWLSQPAVADWWTSARPGCCETQVVPSMA